MEGGFVYFTGTSKPWIPIEYDKLCFYYAILLSLCKETH